MTNRDWAILGFQLVGLWLAVQLALWVTDLPFRQLGERDIAYVITGAVIVISVWTRAGWLASRLFPNPAPPGLRSEMRREQELLVAALSVMGVFLIAQALPLLVDGVAVFVMIRSTARSVFGTMPEEATALSTRATADIAGAAASLLIGIALISRPGRLATGIVAVRRDEPFDAFVTDKEEERTRRVESDTGDDT